MNQRTFLAALTAITLAGCSTGGWPIYEGLSTASPSAGPLESLQFVSGCWRGLNDDVVHEENFSLAGGGSIFGNARATQSGRLVSWEFSRILTSEGQVVLRLYPGGERSPAEFVLEDLEPWVHAVFEDPDHDWPKRIQYRLLQDDLLEVRVDDGTATDSRGQAITLVSVSCRP